MSRGEGGHRLRAAGVLAMIAGALYLGGACANPAAPPGGPPDVLPPELLRVTPESGDTSVQPRVMSLFFDEVVSETPRGASDLADLVFISPRSGDVRVDWRRTRLDIRPRNGFRDSTVYTITIGPGIQDLRQNTIDSITTFVFSTRGPIPETAVTGVIFDWPGGRGAGKALVEAISVVDTTLAFITVADSVGRFTLRHVPGGQYLVRGFIDRNNNRRLEYSELWDTVRIPLLDSARVELYAFVHDTMPVRLTDVAVQDTGRRLRLTFDKPLALAQPFLPDQFLVRGLPDSTPLEVRPVTVRTRSQQAAADSLERQRIADSTAARRDTMPRDSAARDSAAPDSAALARQDSVARAKRRDSLAAAERAEREAERQRRRQLQLRGGRPLPPVDTTPPPEPSRATPENEVIVVLDGPLPPDRRIVVDVRRILSLNGVEGNAQRALLTPKRDTSARARAARDTATARDSTAPPDTTAARDTTARPDTTARGTPPPDTLVPPPDTTARRNRR
jgi:hypothetical protein